MSDQKPQTVRVAILCLAFVFTVTSAIAHENGTNYHNRHMGEVWRVTSLEWPPYSDSRMHSEGNSVQKLRNHLELANIRLTMEFYPWLRAQQIAQHDGYFGYFPAWPEEVKEGFIASPPIDWSEVGVLTRADSEITWTSLEDIFKHRVGTVRTYEYPAPIKDFLLDKKNRIDSSPNERSLLRKLSAKRIDVAITDPLVMHYLAAAEGMDNIKTLALVTRRPLVIAVRDTPENRNRLVILRQLIEHRTLEGH